MSHPAWGAWIEMSRSMVNTWNALSHPAWGAWIEIDVFHKTEKGNANGRTPHGVRGLK